MKSRPIWGLLAVLALSVGAWLMVAGAVMHSNDPAAAGVVAVAGGLLFLVPYIEGGE